MPASLRLTLTTVILAVSCAVPATAQMADFVAALARAEAAATPVWSVGPEGCPATPLSILDVDGARLRISAPAPARPGGATVSVIELTRTGFLLEREGLARTAPRPRYVLLQADPAAGLYGFDIDAVCVPSVPEPVCTPREGFGDVTTVLAASNPCAGPR